jgi:hypothetical protein
MALDAELLALEGEWEQARQRLDRAEQLAAGHLDAQPEIDRIRSTWV